jgi:hypothetical protein
MVMSLTVAALDVIVDSIMVIQSRRYPESGSDELQSYSWVCLSFGGILGSLFAALLTQNYSPRWSFLVSAGPPLLMLAVALRLDASIEQNEGQEEEAHQGFWVELKRNLSEVNTAVHEPVFRRVILFLLLNSLTPTFGSFGYYFMLDVVGVSKFTIGMLGVLGYTSLMAGSALYQCGCHKKEFRTLAAYSVLLTLAFAPLNLLFVLRLNNDYGLPDMFVIVFSDVVSETISSCLVLLPLMVLFAKITPKRIEATAFAFLTGTSNFTGTLRGFVGYLVNLFVGVSHTDLSNYYVLVIIATIMSAAPLLYLNLLPTRGELEQQEKASSSPEPT